MSLHNFNKGKNFLAAGDYSSAIKSFEFSIKDNKGHALSYKYLGDAYYNAGDYIHAINSYREYVDLEPDNYAAHYDLGNALLAGGQLESSLSSLDRSLDLNPGFALAYNALGNLYQEQKQYVKSVESYKKAIELDGNNALVYNNMGNVLLDINQVEDAIRCYQRALQIDPNYYDVYNNLGLAYFSLNHFDKAIMTYDKLLRARPETYQAWVNCGIAWQKRHELDRAIRNFREALKVVPNNPEANDILASALSQGGINDEALTIYKKNLDSNKNMGPSNYLLTLNYSLTDDKSIFEIHKAMGRRSCYKKKRYKSYSSEINPEKILRVGFVSSDFTYHPVSYFLKGLFGSLRDNTELEVYCYSDVRNPNEVTEYFQACSDKWFDCCHLNNEDLAGKIHEDRVDIVVDLAGHTSGNRLEMFAYKPAPIQVNYLGYPNTTGLDFFDYRLVDKWTDPVPQADALAVEKLIRLDGGFLSYTPAVEDIVIGDLPYTKNQYITFASFNNLAKISSESIAIWSQIMNKLPGSVMLFKSKFTSRSNKLARNRILDAFGVHGVSKERIRFVPFTKTIEEHFDCYNQVDIALDSIPYNGTTTTCDSLYMGVPVVCLEGSAHRSRVGVSILNAVGIESLIAETKDDYVDKAVSLAQEIEQLSSYRNNLRQQVLNSPLCDHNRLAEQMVKNFRVMWKTYCNS